METYSIMREFADSWGLLSMMAFFIIAIVMLFRPGAKSQHEDASQIPFRNDTAKVDSNTDTSLEQ
jgi:cytochrome c oxidase cbb3-type subunit 4